MVVVVVVVVVVWGWGEWGCLQNGFKLTFFLCYCNQNKKNTCVFVHHVNYSQGLTTTLAPLPWASRHYIAARSNDRHGVSNYWLVEFLFNSLFRVTTEKHQRSALLSFCEGKMFPFDDVMMTPCPAPGCTNCNFKTIRFLKILTYFWLDMRWGHLVFQKRQQEFSGQVARQATTFSRCC